MVLERTDTRTGGTDTTGAERFAHYVDKGRIVDSMVDGTDLLTLCGKRMHSLYDPSRFPICPECKDIYNGLPEHHDEIA